jgi:N-acetylglucosamine kinase-like BadF-type ATPase
MKVISIDAGGTRCVGALINQGIKEKILHDGFGNILVDQERAMGHIMSIIDSLIDTRVQKIIIGLSGSNMVDTSRIQGVLEEKYQVPVVLITDVLMAYYHVLPQGGILVIAGTGSVVFCKEKEKIMTAGGWGHLFGDEGSGYSIGLEAIKKAILQEEMGMDSKIKEIILKYYKLSKLEEIKFLYLESKSKIAELSYELSLVDDESINEIFICQSQKLAKTVIRMMNKYKIKTKTIGLTGSLMKNELFKNHLKETIRQAFPLEKSFVFKEETEDHTLGGYYYGS